MTDIESKFNHANNQPRRDLVNGYKQVLTRLLLRDQGLNSVTTSKIAKQAGIPVGSVYQYYPNKKRFLSPSIQIIWQKFVRSLTFMKEPLLSMEWQGVF